MQDITYENIQCESNVRSVTNSHLRSGTFHKLFWKLFLLLTKDHFGCHSVPILHKTDQMQMKTMHEPRDAHLTVTTQCTVREVHVRQTASLKVLTDINVASKHIDTKHLHSPAPVTPTRRVWKMWRRQEAGRKRSDTVPLNLSLSITNSSCRGPFLPLTPALFDH